MSENTTTGGLVEELRALADEMDRADSAGRAYVGAKIRAALDAHASRTAEERVTGQELHCDDCQQPYTVWYADNGVWNLVMGGLDAKGDPGGMLCPRCFVLRAEAVYELPVWRMHLDRINRVKQPAPSSPEPGAVEALARLWTHHEQVGGGFLIWCTEGSE